MKERLPAQVLAALFSNSLVYMGEKFAGTEYVYEVTEAIDINHASGTNKTEAVVNKEPIPANPETATPKKEPAVKKPSVVEEKPEPVEEKVNKPGKWYLGNYEKKFIVLVNDEDNVYLGDDDLQFLTGVLNACKMNLAQIALINLHKHPVNFQQLKQDLQPVFIVAFGINALQMELPFSMPDYQVQQYSNCSILTAPVLSQLNKPTAAAKAEKTKLWNCLKKMLNL